jgi:hypothetical protein
MVTIEVLGRVTEDGRLEFELPKDLPPGEVQLIIEYITPEEEAADDEKWERSFAASPEKLDQLVASALEEIDAGLTEELDPDKL